MYGSAQNWPQSSVMFTCYFYVFAEAKAAADAGLKTVVIIREGNAPLSDEDKQSFFTVTSFTELCSSESPKAKRVEGEHKVAKHDEAGKVDGEKKAVHAGEEAAA